MSLVSIWYRLNLITILVFITQHIDIQASGNFLKATSRTIFGEIWEHGEYCGYQRDESRLSGDDTQVRSFYNGTTLRSLEGQELSKVVYGFDLLNYYGIKARKSMATICSTNSWGYADESDFLSSNSLYDNETDCYSRIDQLYEFTKCLSTESEACSCSAKQSRARHCATRLVEVPRSDTYELKSSHQELELLIQLGSFGRVPPGLPFRSHIWIGDYNECMKLSPTRFCFGAYRMKNWPLDEPSRINAINIGLCIPASCNSRSVNTDIYLKKIDYLVRLNLINFLGLGHDQRYQLVDIHCPPANDSPYRRLTKDTLSIILIIAPVIWIGLVMYASIFQRERLPGGIAPSLARCFNLRLIWAGFTEYRDRNSSPQQTELNAIKVLAMIWMLISHIYSLTLPYMSNPHEVRERWQSKGSIVAVVLLCGQHAVPVFFIISGYLIGYKWLHKSIKIRRLILDRYIRLLPMYLLVYAYVKKFAHLIGDGPLWDHGVSKHSQARQCLLESWLVPILMLANFILPFNHCIITGWHIANDFQIILAMPVLLGVYRKSRKWGASLAISAFCVSHFYHIWNFHQSEAFSMSNFIQEPLMMGARYVLDRLGPVYISPIGRLGTYFIGAVLADLRIHKDKATFEKTAQNLPDSRIPKLKVISATSHRGNSKPAKTDGHTDETRNRLRSIKFKDRFLVAVGIIFVCVISYSMSANHENLGMNPYSKAVSYPGLRIWVELVWFSVLYVLLVWHPNDNGTNNETLTLGPVYLLRLPIWNVLIKLNYSIMLTHFTIARYLVESRTQLFEFTWANYTQHTVFIILLSYIAACILHLLIEIPLTSLIRRLMSKVENGRTAKRKVVVSFDKELTG